MPLLQVEATKLSRPKLVRGVIQQLLTESEVLRYLPFVPIVGNSLEYNRELTLGTTPFHAPNDAWTEDAPTFTKITTALKIIGGDADVDQFLQQTYADTNNLRALVIQAKAKALAYKFNDAFINGDSAVDVNSFDGLKKTCGAINAAMAYSETVRAATNGANGVALTLDLMDQFIDAIKPGRPDVLFMSKRSRRKLGTLKRASGSGVLETGADSFGRRVVMYDGIPIAIDENIADNEVQGTSGGVCSSIYAAKFGWEDGVCGIENGGITVDPIGKLETKDAWRTRIKWYVGVAYFRTWSYARFAGILP